MNVLAYEKEVLKVWACHDPIAGVDQDLIALLLDNGKWVISLPVYEDQDVSEFFRIYEDLENLSVRINILTENGWVCREIKVK